MIRKKKLFSRPKKPFESSRIQNENVLVKQYGLKNKKEIWRTIAKVSYFRRRAMELAKRPLEEQEVLFNKLKNLGLKINGTADVLGLKVEDFLERRLPTIVAKKKLSKTVRSARQMVVHKKILINGKVVNSPSYIVSLSDESNVSVKFKKKVKKAQAEVKESSSETPQENPEVEKEMEVKE